MSDLSDAHRVSQPTDPSEASTGGVSQGSPETLFAGNASPGVGRRAAVARPSGSSRRSLIPPKLYRMGEVVAHSGISRQTIHNYTTMGLLRENRWTAGGHRLYDETVFKRLAKIVEMRAGRKSLEDIRKHFVRRNRS